MNRISLDAQGGQWLADMASWARESTPDNNEQLERLRRNLHLARQQALTERKVRRAHWNLSLSVLPLPLSFSSSRQTCLPA